MYYTSIYIHTYVNPPPFVSKKHVSIMLSLTLCTVDGHFREFYLCASVTGAHQYGFDIYVVAYILS